MERFLCSPKGFRERALSQLQLPLGGRALIVGCGSGPEIPIMRNFVGETGHIDAIDISPKQIERAIQLCASKGWENVDLQVIDAAEFIPAHRYDGVVFAFSYIAMSPNHLETARYLWNYVVPGGRMGAMENKLPTWLKFAEPLFQIYVNYTYLGDIRIDPRLDFQEFGAVANHHEVFGSHCMVTVKKMG